MFVTDRDGMSILYRGSSIDASYQVSDHDESLLLNLLIILTKNYIYKCKLNEAKPNTIELKNKIKKYQSFDQYIAKKNNTVQAYEKFWAPIYIILN